MSSRYGSSVIVVQASNSSHHSTYSAPRAASTYSSSSYAPSTISMDSSTSTSQFTIEARYRSGSAAGFYTDIKEVPSSRGGSSTVIVLHNRSHADKDEPRSSDYYQYSGGSRSK
ncbi:hypothetical protein N657DRAFT_680258 [Parathielavia appendiculata]|uniref:Uncharacterized protein n=1 Tax=Parathielavia appendiculata TaxID=2587402 RepID=A0AAN6U0V8_9PEZI|nr:hypothetical protein N657DRAFT_680258 [Parathielavia appendiculata]